MTPSNWVWRTARETSESAWTPPKFTEIPLMTNAMSVPHRGVRPEPSGANVTDLTMVRTHIGRYGRCAQIWWCKALQKSNRRSEEHTSELQSLMRISYAVFCLKKKIISKQTQYEKK